jgi:hypothetical protein
MPTLAHKIRLDPAQEQSREICNGDDKHRNGGGKGLS